MVVHPRCCVVRAGPTTSAGDGGRGADRSRGVHAGCKKALTNEQVIDIRDRITAGEPKSALAREYGISREIIYPHLRTQDR